MGRKAIPGETDLATTHPELAAELVDQELATQLTFGSNRKVEWICPEGHPFPASPSHRVAAGSGCPYCSGRRVLVGYNDLATTHPEVAAQLVDPNLGRLFSAGSGRKVDWVCGHHPDHPFVQPVRERVKGHGCGVCRGTQIAVGYNDLGTRRPDLAQELWDPSRATSLTVGANVMLDWRCAEHPTIPYTALLTDRVKGSGCGICRGLQIAPGYNDLATTHPELAAELWNPEDARTHTAGSDKSVLWRCIRHPEHPFRTTVTSRVAVGLGCGVCDGRQVAVGYNDLGTLHPETAATLVRPEEAATVTLGSGRRLEWVCFEHPEHPFRQSVKERLKLGCGVCAGKQVAVGYNDLATTHPELAAELTDPELATQLSKGSGRKVEWICSVGHRYPATVSSRTNMGSACPICSNRQVLVGYNDLATTHPELAAELADPANGERLTGGSGRKVEWVCLRGHGPYRNSPNLRTSQGQGCPVCGKERIVSRAESLLGDELERRGHRVARQMRVAGFVIDVALPDLLLAVEFDGAYWHHGTEDRDRRKNRALEAAGWTVVRFRERSRQYPLGKIGKWDKFTAPPKTPEQLDRFAETAANQVEKIFARLALRAAGPITSDP